MSQIADNLTKLMVKKGLNTQEISRQTDIPQPTLHKIVTGTSKKPRPETIKKLADYFGINVEDLTQDEAEKSRSLNIQNITLLSWSEIKNWLDPENTQKQTRGFVPTNRSISKDSFAVIVPNESTVPRYQSGSILIFDPKLIPKDGSYVLVQLADYDDVLLRQLVVDVGQKYIKSLNPEFATRVSPLGNEDKILGTLIQGIVNYEEY